MNLKRQAASALLLIITALNVRAEVVSFCDRYLQHTDRPYEMRCIAKRSLFANSVRIINNESAGAASMAYFIGKRADNRSLAGNLRTEITPAGRVVLFQAVDETYEFEIYILLEGQDVKNAYWKVTNRKHPNFTETADLSCYGSLWQLSQLEPKLD